MFMVLFFFFSSRRRHTRLQGDWSSDVCSSDLAVFAASSPSACAPSTASACRDVCSARQAGRPRSLHRGLHESARLRAQITGRIRLLKPRTSMRSGVRRGRRGCAFGRRRQKEPAPTVPPPSARRFSRRTSPKTTWRDEAADPALRPARDPWTAGRAPCPSLSFAACFVYSPRGTGAVCEASRQLCARVKALDPRWLPRYAGLVYRTSLHHPELAGLFAPGAVLVPVPGSAPGSDAPWVALQLAVALRDVGPAGSVWPGLQRSFAVRKSATALRDRKSVV